MRGYLSVSIGVGLLAAASSARADIQVFAQEMSSASPVALKPWVDGELEASKKITSSEKDPVTGRMATWSGASLSTWVNRSLEELSVDRRAWFDLVILQGSGGTQALIPRAFLQKYPLILADKRDGKRLPGWHSVIPWTSRAKKIEAEGAPLETFFVSQVSRVELTNFGSRYGRFFLKRRTDPAAMRGEKLFTQSCVGCHAAGGQGPSLTPESIASHAQHPAVRGAPRLGDRERRALVSYLDAFRQENPQATAGAGGRSAASQASPL